MLLRINHVLSSTFRAGLFSSKLQGSSEEKSRRDGERSKQSKRTPMHLNGFDHSQKKKEVSGAPMIGRPERRFLFRRHFREGFPTSSQCSLASTTKSSYVVTLTLLMTFPFDHPSSLTEKSKPSFPTFQKPKMLRLILS